MGLLSIFKRVDTPTSAVPASEPADAVQRARTRARQRLIGAVVLVIIGVIGFPLVFETQPRPIPVDIPIDVPRKEGAPSLVMPPARTAPPASAASALPDAPVAAAPGDVITESREEAGREVPLPASASAPAEPKAASKPVAKPPIVVPVEPPPKSDVKSPATGSDASRARALLEGKPPAAAGEAGRFIVQVGAFADATAAHETRVKVEKLGFKTYTQVASTSAGNRIRVRVGPFANRAEADKAMAKAKGAGLSAVVLAL